MRTTLRITDRERYAEDLPIFAGKRSREGIYVVVKTSDGLIGLDRDYQPRGFLVDPQGTLWEELDMHPARQMKDFDRTFDDGKIRGDAIWLDLDP
jgi:hypothetical protein